jgi:hypothetical protein
LGRDVPSYIWQASLTRVTDQTSLLSADKLYANDTLNTWATVVQVFDQSDGANKAINQVRRVTTSFLGITKVSTDL